MIARTLRPDTDSQCLAEKAAYDRAMALARVGDRVGHAKAWAEFVKLHQDRPAAVVAAMEKKKGLR